MARPARESALVAEKKPPMLQPKARTAPTPIRSPPMAPFASSPRGGRRIANSLDRSAATRPPRRTPPLRSDPEQSHGTRRSGRRTIPRPVSTQSPQLRMPSDAVHGRSNAKRKTLTVATRTADPQMDQGRPKSTAYCSESERPISRSSLRPLHDEPEDA